MPKFVRCSLLTSMLGVVALLLAMMPASAAQAGASRNAATSAAAASKPAVSSAARHDTSRALRAVARANKAEYAHQLSKPAADPTVAPPPRTLPKAEDAAKPSASADGSAKVQSQMPQRAAMPDLGVNFEGVSNLDDVYPPDTNGDVGGNFYVQWVNLHFQVFDKRTGESLLGPLPGNALWEGFGGPCENQNDGDPIALYDELSGRWMLSQFALFADDGSHQCIAVSQTGDPTGAYYRYDFLISDTVINDYPHFGVWPDAYYMSINQFDADSFDWAGAGAIAFEREQMLQGQPARMVYFDQFGVDERFGGQLPSDLDGAAPPDGAPNIFVEADDDTFGFDTDQLSAWEFHVDWADPASSTFGVDGQPSFTLETEPFDTNMCEYSRSCIPQPDTGVGLDTISDRIMHRLQYRNFGDHQSLVLNHTVDADGNDHAGVRWYELRSTGADWAIEQQGTYAPDAENRWMGSAAMDVSGNIAIGYSVASDATYPSIRVAGRLAGDPAGQLPQAEAEIMAGTGSQTGDGSRWGDYSSLVVDSEDQCTFYYTNEYVETTGEVSWQTRVASFKFPNCSAGPSGTVTGTVTDAGTGAPIARASVKVGSSSVTTDAAGLYSLRVPVGTYDVTASVFGYNAQTVTGVVVAEDATVTRNFALTALPVVTLRGVVTDGSGHGWPLYAKVTVQGTPLAPVFTAPGTGYYQVRVPASTTYTVKVEAQYPGYETLTQDVVVARRAKVQNFSVPVNVTSCTAPGYEISQTGLTEGFDGGALPAGWTNVDNIGEGNTWAFDDPGERGNLTGGEGGFAILDSDFLGEDAVEDASLVTPVADLSAVDNPALTFAQDYDNLGDSADVDVSIDGGATWETVLHQTADARGPRTEVVPLPMAANQAEVQVRFHFIGNYGWWWEVDDVFLGARDCATVPGGLVWGFTTDSNTGSPLNGTKVTSVDAPADLGTSAATPANAALDDGLYWLFSSLTGSHRFTASNGKYVPLTKRINVRADNTTKLGFSLRAGRLTVTPTDVEGTVEMGQSATDSVTYTNTGNAPAHVKLAEQAGDFTILRPDGSRISGDDMLALPGAPLKRITGTFLPTFSHKGTTSGKKKQRNFASDPWASIADFPTDIMDNAMAYGDGKVYSVAGFDGGDNTGAGYVYDPVALTWEPIADLPVALEKPAAAYLDGKLIVFGGWDANGAGSTATYIYDPGSDSWTSGGDLVTGAAAMAVTVADGRIFAWGGCEDACGLVDGQVYDPAADEWTAVADYPEPTSWGACGEIGGTIYCAGGTGDSTPSTHTYAYDVGADSWTQLADLPIDLWGMGYTAASELLLVSGGVTDDNGAITNEGFAYDPGTDSWEAIPNSNETLYRGGSSCGFYRVGGSTGGFAPDASGEVLPGFDQCGKAVDVSWFSEAPAEFDLAPGASATVVVTLDSSQATQPGTFTGRIKAGNDTPYRVDPVDVTMTVTPPPTWGKLTGLVESRSCTNVIAPLPGATVQVNGDGYEQTLLTDALGEYAVWLSADVPGMYLIVAKDTYVPQTRTTDVRAQAITTESFTLRKARC